MVLKVLDNLIQTYQLDKIYQDLVLIKVCFNKFNWCQTTVFNLQKFINIQLSWLIKLSIINLYLSIMIVTWLKN